MRGYAALLRMILLAGIALALAGTVVTAASTSHHTNLPTIRGPLFVIPDDRTSPPRTAGASRVAPQLVWRRVPRNDGATAHTSPASRPVRGEALLPVAAIGALAPSRTIGRVGPGGGSTRQRTQGPGNVWGRRTLPANPKASVYPPGGSAPILAMRTPPHRSQRVAGTRHPVSSTRLAGAQAPPANQRFVRHDPPEGKHVTTVVALQRTGVAARPLMQAQAPVAAVALAARLTTVPVLPTYRLYITQQGDTVDSIAQRFHDVAWLVRRRNAGLWHLAPGMRIRVWQWPFDTAHWVTRTFSTDQPRFYTIQAGDSLWSIATTLHTDVATLARQNGLTAGATIYAGQRLVLHHYTLHQQRIWVPAVAASSLHTGLLLTDMANLVGTDAALVKGLVWNESGWRMVRGASGEIGMVQIMPETAAWVQSALIGYTLDPQVPANNALLGTVLLAYYIDTHHGDTHTALALYHSGNTAADKRNGTYIRAVLGLRAYFYHHPRVGF